MAISRVLVGSLFASAALSACLSRAASFELAVVSSPADPSATTTTVEGLNLVSGSRSMSDDGRYLVFTSRAANLPGGDSDFEQVYLFDDQTGAVSLISRDADGRPLQRPSGSAVISSDGLQVAYTLGTPEEGFEVTQVQVVQRLTDTTQPLTELLGRAPNSMASSQPVMSADGRFVVFVSDAADLVSDDTNNVADIFVLDRQSSEVTRVGAAQDDTELVEPPSVLAVSDDGEVVSFVTARPLVEADTNLQADVYVHLRSSVQTFRLNTALPGSDESPKPVRSALMSNNGRYFVYVDTNPVVFEGGLVATSRVMRLDRLSGAIQHAAGVEPDAQNLDEILNGSGSPSVSSDGRFVSFLSASFEGGVGIRDFELDTLIAPLPGDVFDPGFNRSIKELTLNGDGSAASFRTELQPAFLASRRGTRHFHYRFASGALSAGTPSATAGTPFAIAGTPFAIAGTPFAIAGTPFAIAGTPATVAAAEGENKLSGSSSVSADGRFVVFSTRSASYSDSGPLQPHIVLADTVNGERVLLTAGQSAPEGNAVSLAAAISASGSHVVFESTATRFSNMVEVADDDNGAVDLFVFELASGRITHASPADAALLESSLAFSSPELSASGRYLTFETSNGFRGDRFFTPSVFRRDLKTGALVLVSKTEDELRNDGVAQRPRISADGQTIAFLTNSPRLLNQPSNDPLLPIFIWNSDTNLTRQVALEAPTQFFGQTAALSGNGRFLAYSVRASLDPAEQYDDLYLRDLHTSTTELIHRGELLFVGSASFLDLLVLSHNGRYVGYRETRRLNVVGGFSPQPASLYRSDRFTGEQAELVGNLSGSPATMERPESPAMSADGVTISFASREPLIAYDPDASSDVFIARQSDAGGSIVSAVLPSSRSAVVGATTSAFGTLIASADMTGCSIELAGDTPIGFSWQPIDAATGEPSGQANIAIDLSANTPTSVLFSLSAASPVAPQELIFDSWCANGQASNAVVGLNTLEFSAAAASASGPADIVAIAAGPNGDGTLTLPSDGEYAFFSMATINLGATATVQVVPGILGLDAAAIVCRTNSATGACLSDPAATVSLEIAAGDTPTFAVFVRTAKEVTFNPGRTRVQLNFVDGEGVNRGRTSLALR